MPPHNLFDADCQSSMSMGHLFNSLLTSSMSALAPMCNDSVEPRVYSPTYPMNTEPELSYSPVSTPSPRNSSVGADFSSHPPKSPRKVSVSTPPDPRRPPLNPIKPKATSTRSRRKVGLSINVSPPPSDHHQVYVPPGYNGEDPPPLISCSRNVELRRKSLSERHFFRPVSDDSEDSSSYGMNQ